MTLDLETCECGFTRVFLWGCQAHETSLYTTSVCSGSLLLGAAGILKGVKATTHWCVWHMLPDYEAQPVYARVVQDVITSP